MLPHFVPDGTSSALFGGGVQGFELTPLGTPASSVRSLSTSVGD